MAEIAEQARNKWRSILPMFGIPEACLSGRHCACPICGGGKDRFRFDNKDGRGTWICNQCGAGDGMKLLLLHSNLSFAQAAQQIRERLGEAVASAPPRQMDPAAARRAMNDLWRASAPIGDDEAAAYLLSRGFPGPYPAELRFCASADVVGHPTETRLAAMLARITDRSGKPVNIHRTYLEGAAKARMETPRKVMAGTIPDGSAVRLGSHLGRLGIAEGLETALAVTRRFGLPCWAATNSTLLGKFRAPADVVELHVFGDNDPKFGGQAAAYHCAHMNAVMRNGPPQIRVHIPTRVGTDWADDQPEEIAA